MKTVLFFIAVLLFAGCSGGDSQPEKLTPELKSKIEKISDSAEPELIPIIGKLSGEITDEQRTSLNGTGANVESVVKNIFTASATADQIKKIAGLDFVIQIQLAKKNKF